MRYLYYQQFNDVIFHDYAVQKLKTKQNINVFE